MDETTNFIPHISHEWWCQIWLTQHEYESQWILMWFCLKVQLGHPVIG